MSKVRGMQLGRIPLMFALILTSVAALPGATGEGWAAPARKATKAPAKKAPAKTAEKQPAEPRASDAVMRQVREQARGALKSFYAERNFRPLWVSGDRIGPQGAMLIGYLASADLDDLKPSRYPVERLRDELDKARSGDSVGVARAELRLSEAFARYVMDMRRPRDVGMIYADRSLEPKKLSTEAVLRAAGFPRPFADYVKTMGWMSPQYVRLRELAASARQQGASREELARLQTNLDRARILPGPWVRHVVVDASSGRLWYYEAGKQVGTMRVVVGAEATQTPMLAGMLQWAIFNPYWNVPTYLARNSVAPKVLAGRTLKSLKMEALSDWGEDARTLRQSDIDWRAVAAGTQDVRLRELPGPHNSMGRIKFLFPNDEGIYLHDTPARDLLRKEDRHFSNGCIRLENAAELGQWLLHKPVKTAGVPAEQAVPLPVEVPVYLTYLTAAATDKGLAFRNDVYKRDE